MTRSRKLIVLATLVLSVLAGSGCERSTALCSNGHELWVAGPLVSDDGTGWTRIDGEDNGRAALDSLCGTAGETQGWPVEDAPDVPINGVRPF